MMNKKIASLLIAGALMSSMSMTALAAEPATDVTFCTVKDCTETHDHQHNGTTYAAHHTDCNVSGCSKTGTHTKHNGGGHNSHRSSRGHH